jgi:hypothetical protein
VKRKEVGVSGSIIKTDFKTKCENVVYTSVAQDMKEYPVLAHRAIDLSVS